MANNGAAEAAAEVCAAEDPYPDSGRYDKSHHIFINLFDRAQY
jgi:hypothetical protein